MSLTRLLITLQHYEPDQAAHNLTLREMYVVHGSLLRVIYGVDLILGGVGGWGGGAGSAKVSTVPIVLLGTLSQKSFCVY